MNYQYHNSIMSVIIIFFLSLMVCLRIPYLANISIFILGLGSLIFTALFIFDLAAMADKRVDTIERNKKLKMATADTAKVHQVIMAICTLMVAARGRLYFLLAGLMAVTFFLSAMWTYNVQQLQSEQAPNKKE